MREKRCVILNKAAMNQKQMMAAKQTQLSQTMQEMTKLDGAQELNHKLVRWHHDCSQGRNDLKWHRESAVLEQPNGMSLLF